MRIHDRLCRLSSCMAVSALLLLVAHPASADWQCPVGVDPFGQNNTGVACVWMDEISEQEAYDDYAGPSAPSMVHYSPEEWQAFIDAAAESERRAEEERMRDPVYRELKAGTWDYAESPPKSEARICSATFLTLGGGAMLLDIKDGESASFIGFYGVGIPRAKKAKKLRLSLTQSGETQSVEAMHVPFPLSRKLGMYLFAVPSTALLIDSIEDSQDFSIAVEGKTVAEGRWHSGLEARDWLRRCTAK